MRKPTKVVVVASLAVLLLCTQAMASFACRRTDVCFAYQNSDLVVIGTVTSLETVKDENGDPWYEIAHVKVTETLKGAPRSEVKVYNQTILRRWEVLVSTYDGNDVRLLEGETYIIYGRTKGGYAGRPTKDVVYVGPCDGTTSELLTKSRIRTFHEYLARGTPNQGVYEGIVTYDYRHGGGPIRTAKVQLKRGDFIAEQTVDENGGFRFFDLLPGTYSVTVLYDGHTPLEKQLPREVTMSAEGCEEQHFQVEQ